MPISWGMRYFILTLLAVLIPATASAWGVGMCTKIEWQSFKRIECTEVQTEDGKVFVIVYSRGAFSIVEGRGARPELLQALCDEGAYLVREVDGTTSYVHMCD